MEKQTAIKQINKIGKVGTAVSVIMQIFLIIGMVAIVLASIVMISLPENAFKFSINANGSMYFDLEGFSKAGSILKISESNGSYLDVDFKMNGIDYEVTNVAQDGNRLTLDIEGQNSNVTPSRLLFVLGAALAIVLATMVLMVIIKKLCISIRDCESPFEEEIIKRIQQCAWALIPWTVIAGIGKNVVISSFTSQIDFGMSVSLSTVLVILLIFALAQIFKYGAVLQTESDETL